jgi:hypothetical protein
VIWTRVHPETLTATLARYRLSGADDGSMAPALGSLLHYYVIQGRLSLYWNYFDPVFLFLTGSPDPTLSTRKAGVFLIAFAVLLAAGIYDIVRRSDRTTLLLVGFATAPLAPVLIGTGNAIQRELVILPFAVLIAIYGLRRIFEHHDRRIRACAAVLLVGMAAQFAYFAADYFSAYQGRASARLDPTNVGEAANYMIGRDSIEPIERIYLNEGLDDGLVRWRFHLARLRREDLWARTWIVDPGVNNQWSVLAPAPTTPFDAATMPAASLVLLYANDPAVERLTRAGGCCTIEKTIFDASGGAASVLVRRSTAGSTP